ncbi:exonuclease domain-containing protein [Neptunicella marina]|uniref:3'-5' exonuclease n=1 Tax=Neptunicella marina TaxID=2125989 RepID=A0A8J6ITR4_9ALTE|nr:exonuclease domain-containing protein [Neptunicella marina]MBC3766099.1 3'-5' exonuclease [Neptunicella marina]
MRFWTDARRWWIGRKIRNLPQQSFYRSVLPGNNTSWKKVRWLAVDIETTDLHSHSGEIASIGWVPMCDGVIKLSQAEHHIVTIRREVGQSAVFHQLSDAQLTQGMSATKMMERFLEVAEGCVLVFHNAQLDMAFLNKLLRRLIDVPVVTLVVDTMGWEAKKMLEHFHHIPQDSLRLHQCRQRYHLPDYPAHDALTDALATLELLQAQIQYAGEYTTLGDVLKNTR